MYSAKSACHSDTELSHPGNPETPYQQRDALKQKKNSLPDIHTFNQIDSIKVNGRVLKLSDSNHSIKKFLIEEQQNQKILLARNIQVAEAEPTVLKRYPELSEKNTSEGESEPPENNSAYLFYSTPEDINKLFKKLRKGGGCIAYPLSSFWLGLYSFCNSWCANTSNMSWLDMTINELKKIYTENRDWVLEDKEKATVALESLLFLFILFKKKYFLSGIEKSEASLHALEDFQRLLWKEYYLAYGSDNLLALTTAEVFKTSKASTYDYPRDVGRRRIKKVLQKTWKEKTDQHYLPLFLNNLVKTSKTPNDVEDSLGFSKAEKASLEEKRATDREAMLKRESLLPFYKKYASQSLADFPPVNELSGFANLSQSCFTLPGMLICLFFYPVISQPPRFKGELEEQPLEVQFLDTFCILYNLFHSRMHHEMQHVYKQLLQLSMALQASGKGSFFENPIRQDQASGLSDLTADTYYTDFGRASSGKVSFRGLGSLEDSATALDFLNDHKKSLPSSETKKETAKETEKKDEPRSIKAPATPKGQDYNPSSLEPDNPTQFMEALLSFVAIKKDRPKFTFRLEQLKYNYQGGMELELQPLPKLPELDSTILHLVLIDEAANNPQANLQHFFNQIQKKHSQHIVPCGSIIAVDASKFELFTVCFQFGFSDERKEFIIADSLSRDSCKVIEVSVYDLRSHQFKKMYFEKVATIFHARKYVNYKTPENTSDHFRTSIKKKKDDACSSKMWNLFDGTNVYTTGAGQTDSDEHFACGMIHAITLKAVPAPSGSAILST